MTDKELKRMATETLCEVRARLGEYTREEANRVGKSGKNSAIIAALSTVDSRATERQKVIVEFEKIIELISGK